MAKEREQKTAKRDTLREVKRRRTLHISDADWSEISREAFRRDVSTATLIRQFIKLGLRDCRPVRK